MLKQEYNYLTKSWIWVDEGSASSCGDFRRYGVRQASEIQNIKLKLEKMSNWKSNQYIKGMKGQSTKSSRKWGDK